MFFQMNGLFLREHCPEHIGNGQSRGKYFVINHRDMPKPEARYRSIINHHFHDAILIFCRPRLLQIYLAKEVGEDCYVSPSRQIVIVKRFSRPYAVGE